MKYRRIKVDELNKVKKIAQRTWPLAFGNILSKAQIEYMLNLFYSLPNLKKQSDQNQIFFLYEKDEPQAFFSIEHKPKFIKLHKLYILPECQGLGLGGLAIQQVKNLAKAADLSCIHLNVNRFNASAIEFYLAKGFTIIKEEDIDIGEGYWMEDYVMELKM